MQRYHIFSPFVWALNTFTNPLKAMDGSDRSRFTITVRNVAYPSSLSSIKQNTYSFLYLTTTTWTNIQITRASTISGLKTPTPVTVWTDSTAVSVYRSTLSLPFTIFLRVVVAMCEP